MADLAALLDMFGPFFDRDPLGNVESLVVFGMAFGLPPLVGAHQKRNPFPGLGVDPLVDGFVTNVKLRVFSPKPA